MMFAVVWYTILCVALNKVVSGGGSNLMTDEDVRNLTPEIYNERVEGSKWVFVSEHSFVGAIWSLKTCMLVIYARITYVANHMINKMCDVLIIVVRDCTRDAGSIGWPSMLVLDLSRLS